MWKIRDDMRNHYINGLSNRTFQDMEDRINYLESEFAKIEEDKQRESQGLILRLNAPLDIILMCTICTNSIKSDRGCDGGCRYDATLLEKLMKALTKNESIGEKNE